MNKEEADNLQNGQEIFVKAIFNDIGVKDEIHCYTQETDLREWPIYADMKNVFTALPTANENATENKPKHDPCRRYIAGDIVRTEPKHGRDTYIGYEAEIPLDPTECWTVEYERENGWVRVKQGKLTADIWHGMLVLVHTAEEANPFSVRRSEDGCTIVFEVVKGEAVGATFRCCPGWGGSAYFNEAEAKEAAEAERDRLNDKYQKLLKLAAEQEAEEEEEEEEEENWDDEFDEELDDDKKW